VSPSYPHSQSIDGTVLSTARPSNPALSQQSVPTRYVQNSYYGHSSSVPYQSSSSIVAPPHRSLSQSNTSSGYALPSTPVSSNVTGSKLNLIDSIDLKTEDTYDDPSKISPSQHQQQQLFHPLLQTRSRPSVTPFSSNMQPTHNPYYPSQRPLTPSNDYNMSIIRGPAVRPGPMPTNAYGTLTMQQRARAPMHPSLSLSNNDLPTGMNSNPTGLPSALSPTSSSSTPR
jgi:hypothetical protein